MVAGAELFDQSDEPFGEPVELLFGEVDPGEGVARSLLPLPPWGIPGDSDADGPARQNGGHPHNRRG